MYKVISQITLTSWGKTKVFLDDHYIKTAKTEKEAKQKTVRSCKDRYRPPQYKVVNVEILSCIEMPDKTK